MFFLLFDTAVSFLLQATSPFLFLVGTDTKLYKGDVEFWKYELGIN